MMLIYLKKICILFVIFSICILFGCSENLPPAKKALEIAQNSYAITTDKSVYRFISNFIEQKGDEVKPIGWDVEKKETNKYLVSYKYKLHSFTEGVGEKGFFFEVDLNTESVIDRTNEYMEKMKPLSDAYTDEKEIFNEIINEDNSMDVVK